MDDPDRELTVTVSVRAGVVGLGMMGGGIARSLLAAGLPVAVHDVRPDAVATLVALGATGCPSPAAVAAAADVVAVVVFDAAQVEEVLFGAEGLASSGTPVVAFVCSTIEIDDVDRLAARAEGSSVQILDAGIAGGPVAAAAGGLVTLVGGDDDVVAAARPVLDAMSVEVVHAGGVGCGMKFKLVKNAMSFLTMCAVHEALLLGEELGFDAELVRRVAERSNLVDHFVWFPMSRPSARPLPADADAASLGSARAFADIARKDLGAALAAGAALGVDLPVTELAHRLTDRYFLLPESGRPRRAASVKCERRQRPARAP